MSSSSGGRGEASNNSLGRQSGHGGGSRGRKPYPGPPRHGLVHQERKTQQHASGGVGITEKEAISVDGKRRWWKTCDDLDPITLQPISASVHEPFTLGRNYFDPQVFASYLVSSARFENPATREPMTRNDCKRLDEQLLACRLARLNVEDAFAVFSSRAKLGREESNEQRRQATILFRQFFTYSRLVGERHGSRSHQQQQQQRQQRKQQHGLRVVDDDEAFLEDSEAFLDDTSTFFENEFPELFTVVGKRSSGGGGGTDHIDDVEEFKPRFGLRKFGAVKPRGGGNVGVNAFPRDVVMNQPVLEPDDVVVVTTPDEHNHHDLTEAMIEPELNIMEFEAEESQTRCADDDDDDDDVRVTENEDRIRLEREQAALASARLEEERKRFFEKQKSINERPIAPKKSSAATTAKARAKKAAELKASLAMTGPPLPSSTTSAIADDDGSTPSVKTSGGIHTFRLATVLFVTTIFVAIVAFVIFKRM